MQLDVCHNSSVVLAIAMADVVNISGQSTIDQVFAKEEKLRTQSNALARLSHFKL